MTLYYNERQGSVCMTANIFGVSLVSVTLPLKICLLSY